MNSSILTFQQCKFRNNTFTLQLGNYLHKNKYTNSLVVKGTIFTVFYFRFHSPINKLSWFGIRFVVIFTEMLDYRVRMNSSSRKMGFRATFGPLKQGCLRYRFEQAPFQRPREYFALTNRRRNLSSDSLSGTCHLLPGCVCVCVYTDIASGE